MSVDPREWRSPTAEVIAVLSQIVTYRSRWPRRARYRCPVHDDGYFDEPVAATYDKDAADKPCLDAVPLLWPASST